MESPRSRRGSRWAAVPAGVLAVLSVSCARPEVTPEAPAEDRVVLLRDGTTDVVGVVVVSNPAGAVTLAGEGETTTIAAGAAPTPATTLARAELDVAYADVLASLPPPPLRFIVYFEFGSDQLTEESSALVPEILDALVRRPVSALVLTGHTDSVGAADVNYREGLRRAERMEELLAEVGVDPEAVVVISNGEDDPLVPTPDETREQRNRRVEIMVP